MVTFENQLVAIFVWTTASLSLKGRESHIGWDQHTKQKRLKYIIQNNRFLILGTCKHPNLASKVLSMATKQVASLWERRFKVKPLLAETFVDPEGFNGTCYRAAGWTEAGRTKGFTRVRKDFYQDNKRPKVLWLLPLQKDCLERLRDPSKKLPTETQTIPFGRLPVKQSQANSLYQALRCVKDHRTRKGGFPLSAMLATSILAISCGAQTVTDIFHFCSHLSDKQREALGFRMNKQVRGQFPYPSLSCWRSVLAKVDPEEINRALNPWLLANMKDLPKTFAIDGKVNGKNHSTLVSIVSHKDGQPIAQASASGNGQEQKLTSQLFQEIDEGTLEETVITGDALYANKNLVRKLSQDHGCTVMLQVKNNQKPPTKKSKTHEQSICSPF